MKKNPFEEGLKMGGMRYTLKEQPKDEGETYTYTVSDVPFFSVSTKTGRKTESIKEDQELVNIAEESFADKDTLSAEDYKRMTNALKDSQGHLRREARDYAAVIKKLHGSEQEKNFTEVREKIKQYYGEVLKKLSLEPDKYSRGNAWINWGLAKKIYFSRLSPKDSRQRRDAGPLERSGEGERTRQDIVDEHLGWELHKLAGTSAEQKNLLLNQLDKSSENYKRIEELLGLKRLPGKRLPWQKITALGRLIRVNKNISRLRDLKKEVPAQTAPEVTAATEEVESTEGAQFELDAESFGHFLASLAQNMNEVSVRPWKERITIQAVVSMERGPTAFSADLVSERGKLAWKNFTLVGSKDIKEDFKKRFEKKLDSLLDKFQRHLGEQYKKQFPKGLDRIEVKDGKLDFYFKE